MALCLWQKGNSFDMIETRETLLKRQPSHTVDT